MLEPWNDAFILPPPVLTCSCDEEIDLQDLLYTCNQMFKVLSQQSPLHKESAILARLVYKFDKKFRNDLGYRNLKKVNTALRKYLVFNFVREVENFSSLLPSVDSEELYLPSRQMLQYLLVRLLTFSKLMLRICVCSKQAAVFYLDRVKCGESHWMSLMPYAVLSRIWSMTSVLLQHACSWYQQLYIVRDKLQLKGLPFLPKNYELPSDLKNWLDLGNLDCLGRYNWTTKTCVEVETILGEIDDGDIFDIFKFVNEVNDNDADALELTKTPALLDNLAAAVSKNDDDLNQSKLTQNQDQGMRISRESFKINSVSIAESECSLQSIPVKSQQSIPVKTKSQQSIPVKTKSQQSIPLKTKSQQSIPVKTKSHSSENVVNCTMLKKFVEREDSLRTDCPEQSLTNHLSFMQWQALKINLVKLSDTSFQNRKIQRKFQKIWKDKCLDYV